MLFCCAEEPFNGFFSFVVKIFVSSGVPQILADLNVWLPNMTCNDLYVVCTFGALVEMWTTCAVCSAAFVFSVAVAIGSGIF